MKLKRIIFSATAIAVMLGGSAAITSCSGKSHVDKQESQTESPGGPQLGGIGAAQLMDKSADSTLRALIKDVAPKFKQMEFKDTQTGKTMKYNLFTPQNVEAGKKYPLVLFMADASTVGDDVKRPLVQGYGALVWATDSAQAKNPCYVLVPQYSGVAVNDAYERTDEVDMTIRLLNQVAADNSVDTRRLYATGQSMGGMMSMYFNVAYPDVFAASMFVDCHWDNGTFDQLVKHKFIYYIAGNEGKAYKCLEPIENAARKEGVQYTFASWSAQLPEARQSELAATMLEKGAPVNLFEFEPKTVLPADGKGSEHMYSFDYAYRISASRDWLFKQTK